VTRKSGALTLFGVLVAATLGATTARDTDLAGPAPRAGTIAGTVTLEPPPPPRRTADRYGGRGASIVQRLPAVVYLKGAVAGPAPAGYVANPEMTQRDTAFAPSAVALRVGGTVSFPNRDPFFHNVFSYSSAKSLDLGRYPEGESKEVVFDEPGVVEVFCEVHDFMRGAIVVTENPYHAVVADDGTFAIEGVPAGEYTLVAWHADHREVERSVTVTDGGVVRLEVELRR
jgi:plastocyanin